MTTEYSVREATHADLDEVLRVQRAAFMRVAILHGIDPDVLPPLTETRADLEALKAQGTRFFLAETHDGTAIGSVRAHPADTTVEIGRLAVDDGWQRHGIATALMDRVEGAFPAAKRFLLFTGSEARVPLALYTKRGYQEIRREKVPSTVLVWLEKTAKRDGS